MHNFLNIIRKYPIPIATTVILLAFLGFFILHTRSVAIPVSNPQTVTTATVMHADVSDASSFTGVLQPIHEVDIAAKTSGQLSALYVDVGQRVAEGQTVGKLDTTTQQATAQSITQNITAAQNNVSALTSYYQQQINNQVTQTGQAGGVSDTSATQTATVSALTNAVILAQQVSDTLGTLLSVHMVNGTNTASTNSTFDTYLGVKNSQAKTTARIALESYQSANNDLQSSFTNTVLNKNPSQAQVTDELAKAVVVLTKAKLVLSQTYTVLTNSVTSGDLTDATLATYETNVATVGSQVQTALQNMHDASATIASLQSDRDTKIANAQAQVIALQGQAAVTNTVLADGVIHASQSGVVTTKYVEQGAVVAAGTPLVHIADDSTLKLIVGVPDTQASTFHVGDQAMVLVDDAGGVTSQARITRINPTVDPVSRKVTIELSILNSNHTFKAGSYAHIIFEMPHSASIAIPRSALYFEYGTSYVLVLDGSVVHRRMVTIGVQSTNLVEVLQGLQPGEVVVTAGGDYLRDGDLVTVIQS